MAISDVGDGKAPGAEQVGRPDPGGGGCLRLGWGCLPVLAAVLMVPGSLLF